MNTSMSVQLELFDTSFACLTTIIPDPSIAIREFSFVLNNDLKITKVLCNGKEAAYQKAAEILLEFRPLSQKIVIQCEEDIKSIVIEYAGEVHFSPENFACGYNEITKDLASLSWYSVWYPQQTSVKIDNDSVILLNGSDYVLVKGVYDKTKNVWQYGNKGYDPYNIVAYRKETVKIISNPLMNIYFIDDSIYEHAQKAIAVYQEILNFYNGGLFEKIDLPVLDVACVSPVITIGGGYRRKDFMWCTTLGDSDTEIAWLNAHETAHIWCTGADATSWEDWLNETTAEWSSLLFALEKNDQALFDYILQPKIERYPSLPPIKTKDGSRPEGVHEKGTVLFYEMYKKFGDAAAKMVVRTFADLEEKTTNSLICALNKKGENAIADFISKGILK